MQATDFSPTYYTLDFRKIASHLRSPGFWFYALIISLWIACAVAVFNESFLQYFPDSFRYQSLSLQPFSLKFLIAGERPPVLPILLKLFKSETVLVYFQLLFFIGCWLTLFNVLKDTVKPFVIYLPLVVVLAALSLCRVFFLWNKAVLTESISLSGAVLLLALFCRFMKLKTVTGSTCGTILFFWLFWEFDRDANAYFALCVAIGFFIICTWSRIMEDAKDKWRAGQTLSLVLLLLTSLHIVSINASNRWQWPLVDVIGLRILPDPARTAQFAELGMPVNEKVTRFTNKIAADYNQDWSGFGEWLQSKQAQQAYQTWLIKRFPDAVREIFTEWHKIWNDDFAYYKHSAEPEISRVAAAIALFRGHDFFLFIEISLVVFAISCVVALVSRRERWIAVVALFFAVNLPAAFISYHGDSIDIERHSLNVQLNTYLTGFILIFWLAAFIVSSLIRLVRRKTPA